MLADNTPGLAQFDPLSIGTDFHRPPDGAGCDGVSVIVEPHEAGLRYRGRHRMEPVKPPGIGHQARPLGLEHLPDGLLPQLGVVVRAGIRDAMIEQPGIQLVITLHLQPRREKLFAHQSNLVLTCPFSQPEADVQATGSTR